MLKRINARYMRDAANDLVFNVSRQNRREESRTRRMSDEWLRRKIVLIRSDGVIDSRRMDGDAVQIC